MPQATAAAISDELDETTEPVIESNAGADPAQDGDGVGDTDYAAVGAEISFLVRVGDAIAERELYDAHVDRVYRLAYRLAGSDEADRGLWHIGGDPD